MQPFAYARPAKLSDALALLDEHGPKACLLAGGTDVIVGLRNRTLMPDVVIDLKRVHDLPAGITESGGRLTIGATTTMVEVHDDERVQLLFPALVEAARTVGSIQIRNRATLTGNICHASPAADTAPALLVYGAGVNITSAHGTRRVDLNEFFLGPGRTVLERAELVTSIDLPNSSGRHGARFARITRRRGVDLATISVCCMVEASGRTRFAFGAVGPRPFLVDDDSGVLADPSANDAAKDDALKRVVAHASPISDVRGSRDYREGMLLVMSRRVLGESIARLQAS